MVEYGTETAPIRALRVFGFANCLAILCLTISLIGSVRAQTPKQQRFDPTVEVIPYRSIDKISREIDNATSAKELASYRRQEAEDLLRVLDPNIKTRKAQVAEIEARRNVSKSKGNRSEMAGFESEIRANNSAINMLGRLKDLRKAEVEAAVLRETQADKTIQALQLEMELNKRRADRDSLDYAGNDEVVVTTASQIVYDLESKLLNAQKDLAEVTQKVSAKEREIVERRMRLYQAQAKLASPKT